MKNQNQNNYLSRGGVIKESVCNVEKKKCPFGIFLFAIILLHLLVALDPKTKPVLNIPKCQQQFEETVPATKQSITNICIINH